MAGCSPACGRDGGGERRVRLRNSDSARSARAWRSPCRTCIRTSRSMRRRIPAADPCRSIRIQALDPASIAPSLLIRDRLCATFRGWAILWRARLMAAFYWPRSSPWRERTITNCQIAAFVASGCRNRRRTVHRHGTGGRMCASKRIRKRVRSGPKAKDVEGCVRAASTNRPGDPCHERNMRGARAFTLDGFPR